MSDMRWSRGKENKSRPRVRVLDDEYDVVFNV